MTVWFTSDTHFGHVGILGSRMARPRPFKSIEEHDEVLVARWNGRVRPGDQVWHLGDFAYGASAERCRDIFSRLAGKKHLVWGNHDNAREKALPWASQQERALVTVDGVSMVLGHYAQRVWYGMHRGDLHLYGHSHGSLPGTSASLDVGVDCWAWAPVQLSEIREALAETAAREAGAKAAAALAEAA
jgi:calcineurin-like phosphoesterase family protein